MAASRSSAERTAIGQPQHDDPRCRRKDDAVVAVGDGAIHVFVEAEEGAGAVREQGSEELSWGNTPRRTLLTAPTGQYPGGDDTVRGPYRQRP
jgi:hypothetical protein